MENKFDKNECMCNELSMDLEELELDQLEIDLEGFMNSDGKLYDDTEYIVYNNNGDTYFLRYDFENDNGDYEVNYSEHHYTKFWNENIQAKEYLNLKAKYIQKHYNNIRIELDLEDDCHPTLDLFTSCKEKDMKETLQFLENIHNDFDKKFNILREEVQKLISNFEL